MNRPQLFSSGDFAKLAQTTRKTLHLYDRIGLLPPAERSAGKFRYYSAAQLSIINLIRILQELGMTLEEIIEVKDRRTPEFMDRLLVTQMGKIDQKIEDWVRARKLLLTLQKTIHIGLDTDSGAVGIQFLPAEAIILGEINDYSNGRDDYSALQDFYHSMRSKYPYLDLNYPVWARFSGERILGRDWRWPDRYYFYNPEGYDKRPAGYYATGCTRGGYGRTDELYERLIRYIDENGFEICGDAYEEYPLNELSISCDDNYLIRVLISVRERG